MQGETARCARIAAVKCGRIRRQVHKILQRTLILNITAKLAKCPQVLRLFSENDNVFPHKLERDSYLARSVLQHWSWLCMRLLEWQTSRMLSRQ